jgi:hypothetical protein
MKLPGRVDGTDEVLLELVAASRPRSVGERMFATDAARQRAETHKAPRHTPT